MGPQQADPDIPELVIVCSFPAWDGLMRLNYTTPCELAGHLSHLRLAPLARMHGFGHFSWVVRSPAVVLQDFCDYILFGTMACTLSILDNLGSRMSWVWLQDFGACMGPLSLFV